MLRSLTFRAWLKALARRFRPRPLAPFRRVRPRQRLRLEEFEDRVVPATITWTNAAGGSWQTGANWNLLRAPLPGDDVVVPDVGTAGATVTITSSADVSVNSLSLAENLTITAGAFGVVQQPTLTGAVTVTGGVFLPPSVASGSNLTVGAGAAVGATGVPSAGLLAYWHLDGSATDVVSSRAPSASNAVTYQAARLGSGFKPGSASGFIDYADAPELRTQQVTLSAWVRPDGAGLVNPDGSIIFGKQYNRLNGVQISSELGWSGQSNAFWFGAGGAYAGSPGNYPAKAFYHVVGTYDGSAVRLYINGVLVGQTVASPVVEFDSTPWTIGASGAFRSIGYPRTFNGVIDEVAILNRALSALEIQTMAAGGAYTQTGGTVAVSGTLAAAPTIQGGSLVLGGGVAIPGAVGYWRGEGTAADSVGANPGTIQNGASITDGRVGQAFQIVGNTSSVSIPDAPALRVGSLTVATWANFTDTVGLRHLIAKNVGGGIADSFDLYYMQGAIHAVVCNSTGGAAEVVFGWPPRSAGGTTSR